MWWVCGRRRIHRRVQGFGHEDSRTSLWQTGYSTAHELYQFVAKLNTVRNLLFRTPSESSRVIAVSPKTVVLSRAAKCHAATADGADGETTADGEATAGTAGGDHEGPESCAEIIIMLTSWGRCSTLWYGGKCAPAVEYCADEPVLPQPPAGWVWADAISGWVANMTSTSAQEGAGPRCVSVPDAEPKAMQMLPVATAIAEAARIAADAAAAKQAWESDYKYV